MYLIIIVSVVVILSSAILYYYYNRVSISEEKKQLDKSIRKSHSTHWIRKGPKGPWG